MKSSDVVVISHTKIINYDKTKTFCVLCFSYFNLVRTPMIIVNLNWNVTITFSFFYKNTLIFTVGNGQGILSENIKRVVSRGRREMLELLDIFHLIP